MDAERDGGPEVSRVYPVQEPLRLRYQAAFWLFVMLVGGCAVLVITTQLRYFAAYPSAWVLSVVLLAITSIPAGVILYRLDEFEPEPASLIAVAVIWGGVVALTFASIVNGLLNNVLQHVIEARTVDAWAASLTAPINEELYKGMGLVVIYLMARREIDTVMDGLIYGAMIGLGFQVMENIQYFMLAADGQAGAAQGVISMFFLRVIVSGLYSHMLFSGFVGFGFAYFVTQRTRRMGRRVGVLVLCVFLAWAAHFVWNSPWLESLMAQGQAGFVGALVIKGLPFLSLMVILWVFADRREKRVFGCLMRSELGGDVVSQGEFYILRSSHRRRKELRRMKRKKGAQARALMKRLMREQINLALLHSRVSSYDDPALEEQRAIIRSLRGSLATLPVLD